jgi:TolA-binding protein
MALAVPAHSSGLAAVVKAYRESSSPARRSAVEAYASAHPKEAPQARFALGVVAYEQKNYPEAIASLKSAAPGLPQVADYVA